MDNEEKMLWDLFCATGEPRYYSMYVEQRDRSRAERKE